MSLSTIQTHVSIDTIDLAATVAFYRALLDAEPALLQADYARFDVAEPPLVLGLNAVSGSLPRSTGALEHLGIRFRVEAELDAARSRIDRLGTPLVSEPLTDCCYARLARAWATDPSGVRWELFVALEPVVEMPSRAGPADSCCAPTCCATIEP